MDSWAVGSIRGSSLPLVASEETKGALDAYCLEPASTRLYLSDLDILHDPATGPEVDKIGLVVDRMYAIREGSRSEDLKMGEFLESTCSMRYALKKLKKDATTPMQFCSSTMARFFASLTPGQTKGPLVEEYTEGYDITTTEGKIDYFIGQLKDDLERANTTNPLAPFKSDHPMNPAQSAAWDKIQALYDFNNSALSPYSEIQNAVGLLKGYDAELEVRKRGHDQTQLRALEEKKRSLNHARVTEIGLKIAALAALSLVTVFVARRYSK